MPIHLSRIDTVYCPTDECLRHGGMEDPTGNGMKGCSVRFPVIPCLVLRSWSILRTELGTP